MIRDVSHLHTFLFHFTFYSQCKNVKSPQLQHIFEHSQLRSLNLGFMEDISDETFMLLPCCPPNTNVITRVGGCSPLQKLNLCKSNITDMTIFRMAYLIALVEVRLQWCSGITDAGIASLARSCPRLRLLDLRSCHAVTDSSVAAIAELCSELRVLDLSWCGGVSEEGLLQLVPPVSPASSPRSSSGGRLSTNNNNGSSKKQGLEHLSLEWCERVTDRFLRALQTIESLRTVQLTGCSGVTAEGLSGLRKSGKEIVS